MCFNVLNVFAQVIDELVDAEVCEVAKAARAILLKAMGEGQDKQSDPASPTSTDATCMYRSIYVYYDKYSYRRSIPSVSFKCCL